MNKTVRCSIVLSITCLMTLAQPSEHIEKRKYDSNIGFSESSINSEKIVDRAFQNRTSSNFHDNNLIEKEDIPQDKNFYKNSNFFNSKIGNISEYDFALLCQLVAAEAENQCFEGKRAVAAVVLNRVDYGYPFADSIEGVIFQDNQFSCISDGRFFDAINYVSEEDKAAVTAELDERSDPDILFFTAGDYGSYGTPAYQIGDHFFCTK